MKEPLEELFRCAVAGLLEEKGDAGEPPAFALEISRSPEHGDFACNAALVLAKRLRQPPRAIAERLAADVQGGSDWVERVEIAGPGFVNVWLRDSRWHDLLVRILEEGRRYGTSKVWAGQSVQVEFVSANPTGPLTLGHGRQGVLGDCIARLLEATGYDVTREYYFNNGGRQMRILGESVKARYLEQLGRAAAPPREAFAAPDSVWPLEIDGLPVVFPRDGYQGDYISEIADSLRQKHGEGLADEPGDGVFRKTTEERIFSEIRETLTKLRIEFDVYSNETTLYEEGRVEAVLRDLRAKGCVYEQDGAVWLRSIDLGLDRDRVLVRKTGEPTYLLPDIAYHRQKFERGFDAVIDVQGADHIEQFPFVVAAVRALGCEADRVELVMHQFVTLTESGRQVKQSKRRANYITVDELMTRVGVDVFRFFMVQRRAEGHLDFDLDLATETDWKKNPAFYVQYAHARTCGIERKAREQGVSLPDAKSVGASALVLREEIEILKKVAEFPEVIARAGATREPHHVSYYLRDLAGLWNPYLQDGTHHRVVSDDAELSRARLGLARAVRTVLASGLALLGVSAPEQM